ncbi:MAG: hypothetical protein ACRDLP_04825 [Solirubrobacteraceae bacterium]
MAQRLRINDAHGSRVFREFVTSMDREELLAHLRRTQRFLVAIPSTPFRRWRIVDPPRVSSVVDEATGVTIWPEGLTVKPT